MISVANASVIASLALAACTLGGEPSAEPKDAAALDATEASAPEQDAATSDELAPQCIVSGQVTDMIDQSWLGATVQVCSEALCTLGKAASGSFAVGVPCGARYHVIAHEGSSDTRPASAGIGVIAGDVTSDVTLAEPVRIPVTPPPASLATGTQSLDVTPELTLTLDPADLVFYGDETSAAISAVRIDPARWPAFVIQGQTILAMWALDPWGIRTRAGKTIAVSVKNVFGLQAGDAVGFYGVSETTASLLAPAQGNVTSDAALITGATVDRVTWIVMAR